MRSGQTEEVLATTGGPANAAGATAEDMASTVGPTTRDNIAT